MLVGYPNPNRRSGGERKSRMAPSHRAASRALRKLPLRAPYGDMANLSPGDFATPNIAEFAPKSPHLPPTQFVKGRTEDYSHIYIRQIAFR